MMFYAWFVDQMTLHWGKDENGCFLDCWNEETWDFYNEYICGALFAHSAVRRYFG